MTQVPLKILITQGALTTLPEIALQLEKLQKAGHDVTVDDRLSTYDVITGPNCWLLRPEVAGLFTLAITNARRIVNADQERAKQSPAKKVAQRKPRAASTAHRRGSTVKAQPKGELDLGTILAGLEPAEANGEGII